MTVRNPLVRVGGKIEDLPAGDVLGGAAQGPVGMTWEGAWSSTTSYNVDDVVSSGGSSYICIAANTNQSPPNATYWNLVAQVGATGATGPTGAAGPTGATGSAGTNGTNGTNGAMSQIAQIVTASSQATADFASLSLSSYNSILITWFGRDTASGTSANNMRVKFNNDGTAANYTTTYRTGSQNGSAFSSSVASSTKGVIAGSIPNDGNTAGMFSTGDILIVAPGSTTLMKRTRVLVSHEDGTSGGLVYTGIARWASTAAITRITFSTDGTAFKDGSTFTLYGF